MGALDGIHVLDFTQVIFGPTCTQVLAHHGADVIKIERPGQDDLSRGVGVSLQGESLAYACLNLSKCSIVLNLRTSEGMAIIHRLLAKTDVLVHNFRPGVMAMQAWEISALLNVPSPAEDRTDADSREVAVANADAWPGDVGGLHLTGPNPSDGAIFRTSNGYLMVSAIFRPYPEPLRNLCTALGIQDLSTDPRFATMADLISNAVSLRSELEPVFASHTTAKWVQQLEAHDILCAPIRSTAEAFQDPQLAVNALLVEVEHSRLGKLRFIGTPVRLSSTPARPAQAAPMMGEHTDEILREVEYSAAEIADFCAGGIVA